MAYETEVKIDNWIKSINLLRASSNKTLDEVWKDESRLLGQELILRTPPLGVNMRSNRKVGESALRRDILRSVHMLNETSNYDNPRIKAAIVKKDVEALKSIQANSRLWKGMEFSSWKPEIHRDARNKRYNTVSSGYKPKYVSVDMDGLAQYYSDMESRVGKMASHWLFGQSLVDKDLTRIPAWITRHGTNGAGSYVNNEEEIKWHSINTSLGNWRLVDKIAFVYGLRSKAIVAKILRAARDSAQNAGLAA